MQVSKIYRWVSQYEHRKTLLLSIQQPMTAKQLSRVNALSEERCSYLLGKFAALTLCTCLNPQARNSRLYWTTDLGRKIQYTLQKERNLPQKDTSPNSVNWSLYGWVCYRHRSVVVRVLTKPMQPSEIRHKIRYRFPKVKISANNVRDIIRLFEQWNIVERISIRKKVHPRYQLTDSGLVLQMLLNRAENGFISPT